MQSVGLSERGKSLILGMTFLLSATWNLLWTCTVVFSVHCASSLAVLRVRIPLSICYAGQQQEGEQDGSAEFFSFSYLAEKAAENNCGDSVSVVTYHRFCQCWRTELMDHSLNMIEINPFFLRCTQSLVNLTAVKEVMHSSFSTAGFWMASWSPEYVTTESVANSSEKGGWTAVGQKWLSRTAD